jgi:hypothetical protein
MVKKISKGLKWTFLINFIVYVVFGVLLFFLIEEYLRWLGISIHPLLWFAPFYFGGLFGGVLLAFASASFFAWQQTEWERVKIIVMMNIVWGALGTFIFVWVTIDGWPVHPMTLMHLTIFSGFLVAFILLYIQHEKEKRELN